MTTQGVDIFEDLTAEYDRLEGLLAGVTEGQWELASGAPGWALTDVVLHLALTEEAVTLTLTQPAGTWTVGGAGVLDDAVASDVRRERSSGPAAFERWRAARRASLAALAVADPDRPVNWAAAPLKPRTLATTRLAEHWAHGLDLAEPLGWAIEDTDRLRHIAWLGHATLPYSQRLAGLEPAPVHCILRAPSGATWTFGPSEAASRIVGDAGAFCRVGARRLNAADSGLVTSGPHGAEALNVLRNYAA